MVISEQWIPIIAEGVKWAKDMLGPSKKELNLKIVDLEKQVRELSNGNQVISQNIGQVMAAIFNQLRQEGNYSMNSKYITVNNRADFSGGRKRETNNKYVRNAETQTLNIFDGMDEEIQYSRLVRPSERR